MKYYIVALFDDETYQLISPIQRNMSKKFRANRNSPNPFIPLAMVDTSNLDKICDIVEKNVKQYKTFRIDVSDLVYLSESNKSVNLKIDNKGYIKRLSRSIIESLSLNGFASKSFEENPIVLANLGYVSKDYKKQDIKLHLPNIYNGENSIKLRVKSIEIWKLPIVKKNQPLKSIILKSF